MNWARRLFKILLQRKAGIFHPTLIQEINDAVRPDTPGHHGNCVNDKPEVISSLTETQFTLAQGRGPLENPFSERAIPPGQNRYEQNRRHYRVTRISKVTPIPVDR